MHFIAIYEAYAEAIQDGSFLQVFRPKPCVDATWAGHLVLLPETILTFTANCTNRNAPYYGIFLSQLLIFPLLDSSIFLKILLSTTALHDLCSSLNVRDQVSHLIPSSVQSYSFVYFNLFSSNVNVLDWMIASILCEYSALGFLVNKILMCSCCSRIFEHFSVVKEFIRYFLCLWFCPAFWRTHTKFFLLFRLDEVCKTRGRQSCMMGLARVLISLKFCCHSYWTIHRRNPAKLNVVGLSYIEIFKNEERWQHVTLYVSVQNVKLDFGFGPQPVLISTGLVWTNVSPAMNKASVFFYSIHCSAS